MAYEVIKSETTYRGKIVDVTVDIISLPDGRRAEREIVRRGAASAVLPVDADGNVYLVRQYRHSMAKLCLEAPAGVMDPGETDPEACARRELTEETGFAAGRLIKLTDMVSAIGFSDEILHIYAAEDLIAGETDFDDEEFITVEKYPLNDAIDMIHSGEIFDSKTIAALLLYDRVRGGRNG